jgi:hypothetical protein
MEVVADGSPRACLMQAFDHLKHDWGSLVDPRTSSLEPRWGQRTMIGQRRR